jgi:hypothetical protein
MVAIYRKYVAEVISSVSHGNFMVPELSDALIAQFPKILNCPDLWLKLCNLWGS